jgi:hypothetical protein
LLEFVLNKTSAPKQAKEELDSVLLIFEVSVLLLVICADQLM